METLIDIWRKHYYCWLMYGEVFVGGEKHYYVGRIVLVEPEGL